MLVSIHNDGQRITSTNFWELAEYQAHGKFYVSINAGCVRLLVPRSRTADAHDMAAAKVAVVSIGPCRDWNNMDAAHIMFDDGSDSPYCLFTELRAFDVLPTTAEDARTDLTCAVYTAGEDLAPNCVCTLPCRIRHTPIPNFAAVNLNQ